MGDTCNYLQNSSTTALVCLIPEFLTPVISNSISLNFNVVSNGLFLIQSGYKFRKLGLRHASLGDSVTVKITNLQIKLNLIRSLIEFN